jgi:hypothetical protein
MRISLQLSKFELQEIISTFKKVSLELSLKCLVEAGMLRKSGGRAFQAAGPACEKARSPNLVCRRGRI